MTLDELYELCAKISDRHVEEFDDGDARTSQYRQALNVAEEAGEFVGAFRRWMGLARRSGTHVEMSEELADVVISSMFMARVADIDLPRAMRDKLIEIQRRGYREAEDTTINSGEASAAERAAFAQRLAARDRELLP